jgi:beta-lactamase class A
MEVMLKYLLAAAVCGCCLIKMNAQPKQSIENLREKITLELQKDNGLFAVAFKDLGTGKTVLINDKITFHAASTMKTPVLIEIYKQAAAGKFSLKDSMVIKNSFSSIVDGSEFTLNPADDSQLELYGQIGQKKTIADLAYQMIIASSNLATNMMIELVKAENVMKTMKAIGANDIQVLRGVEDNKAFEKGLNNTTTAFDQLLIFEKLAKNQLVSRKVCEEMISILLDQKFKEIIPAQLPAEVKVAHKTGSITGIQHDAGIVFLPDGRKYVLILLSKFEGDEKLAQKTMANVSKLVYDYMSP